MRFLLGADFHLGAPQAWLGDQAGQRRRDLERAFVRFTDFATDPGNAIDAVLLLGDLFDSHDPPPEILSLVLGQMDRVIRRGIALVAIPGSHDGYGYPNSVYRTGRFPGELVLITSPGVSRTTRIIGDTPVHFYGMAFDPGRTPASPLDGLARDGSVEGGLHIGLIHGSLPAGPEWAERGRDIPIPTADLPSSGIDILALGHYHNFLEKRFGTTLAIYPGTLEGLKYSESGPRAFVVVAIEGGPARVERTPFQGRRIDDQTMDLDLERNPREAVEEKIRCLAGPDSILRLRLQGHAPPDLDAARLLSRWRGEFFHLCVDDRTLKVAPEWADRLAMEHSVRGLFVQKIRRRMATAEGSGLSRLEEALRTGLAEFASGGAADVD